MVRMAAGFRWFWSPQMSTVLNAFSRNEGGKATSSAVVGVAAGMRNGLALPISFFHPVRVLPPIIFPVGLVALALWLTTQIRYRIDDRFLRVVLLGITVRKIALADIESVTTAMPLWNEHWCNTLWPVGRVVCIRRKTGLIRNFTISPANRDAFLDQLKSKLGRSG